MIRYRYIENIIYKIYNELPRLSFPIHPEEIVKLIPNCRIMTYKEFAKMNCCTVMQVSHICQSDFGCSHFDQVFNRFLIIYNDEIFYGNSFGKQRWTIAHEIGHILCGHFQSLAASNEPLEFNDVFDEYNYYFNDEKDDYEIEADFFAANLLSPLVMFEVFDIKDANSARWKFGLSQTASKNRYNQYVKWRDRGYHFNWDKAISHLYSQKLYRE